MAHGWAVVSECNLSLELLVFPRSGVIWEDEDDFSVPPSLTALSPLTEPRIVHTCKQ